MLRSNRGARHGTIACSLLMSSSALHGIALENGTIIVEYGTIIGVSGGLVSASVARVPPPFRQRTH